MSWRFGSGHSKCKKEGVSGVFCTSPGFSTVIFNLQGEKIMQPVFYKTQVYLDDGIPMSLIELGDKVRLLMHEGKITVGLIKPHKVIKFSLKRVHKNIGTLSVDATGIISDLISRNAKLRVRVVDITPTHLRPGYRDLVYISIWAKPKDISRFELPSHLAALYKILHG